MLTSTQVHPLTQELFDHCHCSRSNISPNTYVHRIENERWRTKSGLTWLTAYGWRAPTAAACTVTFYLREINKVKSSIAPLSPHATDTRLSSQQMTWDDSGKGTTLLALGGNLIRLLFLAFQSRFFFLAPRGGPDHATRGGAWEEGRTKRDRADSDLACIWSLSGSSSAVIPDDLIYDRECVARRSAWRRAEEPAVLLTFCI